MHINHGRGQQAILTQPTGYTASVELYDYAQNNKESATPLQRKFYMLICFNSSCRKSTARQGLVLSASVVDPEFVKGGENVRILH